jgi:Xaa-Pro aminopeptidase
MKKYFGAYPVSDPLLSGPTHPCVSTIRPISENEFGSRQLSLAQTLVSLNGEAYIAEPGAQTQFIGNFSHVNWKLSERPLFLIITPRGIGNSTEAEVSVLTPKFEGTRAKLLSIPFATRYIEWAEEENPYAVAVEALGFNLSREGSLEGKKLFIDNSARHFHYDGFSEVLKGTGVAVTSAPPEINRLREQKSATEIEIMKCVHEVSFPQSAHYALTHPAFLRPLWSLFAMFTSRCISGCENPKRGT